MAFLRVVEVFPPLYPSEPGKNKLNLKKGLDRFLEDVDSIKDLADVVLVANLKDPELLRFSSLEAAVALRERLGVEACPVLVVRDTNRIQFLSSVLSGVSLGLRYMMIAWGDRYPKAVGSTNVRDFKTLGESITQAMGIVDRSNSPCTLLSTMNLDKLSNKSGLRLAEERLNSGARLLLAQPPTTDPGVTFRRHSELLEKANLKSKVLLNVFPFRNKTDVDTIEARFGWRLPESIHEAELSGGAEEMCRGVIKRLRIERFPGVYLSTRGDVDLAKRLLS